MKQDADTASAKPDASWTVNEVIVTLPDSVAVFNAFGVDSCCRGDATLEQAAFDAGLEPDDLVSAITSLVLPL
jgi:iron-sulfur cluster repair protein YtfE (RIC family)